jgi:hypothetical protein
MTNRVPRGNCASLDSMAAGPLVGYVHHEPDFG